MKAHTKHVALQKPALGFCARNELSLVGAPCGLIERFFQSLRPHLTFEKIAYVDAEHSKDDEPSYEPLFQEFTDKISHFQLTRAAVNSFDKKILLNEQDLVVVNGNHEQAASQIVFIHPSKEASLQKRLAQLTNILAIVLCEGATEVYNWLESDAPIYNFNDFAGIAKRVNASFNKPVIKGLILAGGKSQRMGSDKALLAYHGKPQIQYLQEELRAIGVEAFVSCRPGQYTGDKYLEDAFAGLGPYGGLLSAFRQDPNACWLVAACDLPNVNREVFEELIAHRNSSVIATAFYNAETNLPDPLLTLWEPRSYMRLLEFLALGYSCPRKVLINSDIALIHPKSQEVLRNVNTPEEKRHFEIKGS